MPMIQAHALNLSFGTGAAINQVLHDVSLSVADGESFGLVGESGSARPPYCAAWPGNTGIGTGS